MKFKNLFLLITLSFLFSCEHNDIVCDDLLDNEILGEVIATRSDFNVSLETATYAARFLSDSEIVDIEPLIYQGKDTVLYIVTYQKGWTLLSADMRAKPVLANSTTGTFKDNANNQGSTIWLNKLANEVLGLKKNKSNISYTELQNNENFVFWNKMYLGTIANKTESDSVAKYYSPRKALQVAPGGTSTKRYYCKRLINNNKINEEDKYIGERLKTFWHQNPPFNQYVPMIKDDKGELKNALVGCTAVAMGQIIYDAHYKLNTPTGLNHGARYITGSDYKSIFYNGQYTENSPHWDQMVMGYEREIYYTPHEGAKYVAELLAELGNKLGMEYGLSESSSTPSVSVMREYGLTWDEGPYNSEIISQNLERNLPVLISSYSEIKKTGWWIFSNKTLDEGHAWVIDGIKEHIIEYKSNYIWELVEVRETNNERDEIIWRARNRIPSKDPIIIDENVACVYHSLSEVYHDYEQAIEYTEGKNKGVYSGKSETKTYQYKDRRFLMNWGWGKSMDEQSYATNATEWEGDRHTYKYDTKIYYNLRKY